MLEQLTGQEVFDRVAVHLLTQKRKALRGTTCMYRAPNGDKCAVGCLIPDKDYDPRFENKLVHCLIDEEIYNPVWLVNNQCLLAQLQHIHDKTRSGAQDDPEKLKAAWYADLKSLAEEHKLSPAILDTV